MASIAMHSAGKLPFLNPTNKPAKISCTSPLPPKKIARHFSTASIAAPFPTNHQSKELNYGSHIKCPDVGGKIDSWVYDSVEDIVKNLKHAPLLVQIYSEFDGGVKTQTEKAVSDKWAVVRDGWRSGESKSPDGLIYVEELERESSDEEGERKAWGMVVQGKGAEYGPACYMLKTDQVCAGLGLGFCTHFCLMRVSNFRDSALEQLRNSWLLK